MVTIGVVALLSVVQLIISYRDYQSDKIVKKSISNTSNYGKQLDGIDGHHMTPAFRWFQLQYLSVFLTVMLADWLQGTNMYTLYASYGMDIGTLFLTGFLSSAIFGTCLGVYVDIWGRKLGCIIFCLLEIIINLLEHIPSMPLLLVGRVLGGLSTSLLFSAFESWMVAEHRRHGFPETWLASTFGISSWANGFMAICAGFLAQVAADASGDIGPFQVAIALTVVSLILIVPWHENYGNNEDEGDKLKTDKLPSTSSNSLFKSIRESVAVIIKHPTILCLGLSQAFFEGGMFTFVFIWVPAMIAVAPGGPLPTGLVFSSLMLAMTIGGMLSSILLPFIPGGSETMSVGIYLVAAVAMAVPIYNFSFWWVYVAFIVLEAMVGMYYSCGGVLRSKYYPEAHQSSIMSVFRLPLNALVVIGTNMTNNASSVDTMQGVFRVVAMMHVVAMIMQIGLVYLGPIDSQISSQHVDHKKLD